jgi:hypothetical protein
MTALIIAVSSDDEEDISPAGWCSESEFFVVSDIWLICYRTIDQMD